MITYATSAFVVGALMSLVGVAMIIRSLVSASRRGKPIAFRFWAPAEMFMADELARNRRGLYLAVAGILVLAFSAYLLA